jgi:hypothetical protein
MKISLGMTLRSGAWGGGNQFGHALSRYLEERGIEVYYDLNDPELDLILLADPRIDLEITAYNHHDILHYLRRVNPNALVVQRVNECDERKAMQGEVNPKLRQAARIADHSVFVSGWLRDLHLAQGMETHAHSVILNGSEPMIFHPQGYRRWDGQEPLRLVTHHWGRDWLKGFDIYQQLDEWLADPRYQKRITFTYIGNLPDGFRFQRATYREPLSGKALADALRAQHVYITASRNEPGSNHQNEGALCGLPLLYIESGSIPEYAQGFGIAFTPETFQEKLDEMLASYDHWADRMADYPHTADHTSEAYYRLFMELLENREAILNRRRWVEQIRVVKGDRSTAVKWLRGLPQTILPFLESLKVPGQAGRFFPAGEGLTRAGREIALPFSCLALKTVYMLGAWDQQAEWLEFIRSFQVEGNPLGEAWGKNAFVDSPLTQRVIWQTRRWRRLWEKITPPKQMTPLQRLLSAESKQAIAALADVGAETTRPYQGFPVTPQALKRYLDSFDWSKPWASGAHLATLAVFYRTQAPRFLPDDRVQELLGICHEFVGNLVDPASGTYFRGQQPGHGELINGAMKILTALDWLEIPVHLPEKLIDTTLSQAPLSEGCHLVDAVYVLYRCGQQTDYRQKDIEAFCIQVVDMMIEHYNPLDGGFSYNVGSSQTHMHRVHITRGRPVSDIHGTVLLTWAAAMILHLLGEAEGWKVIRP